MSVVATVGRLGAVVSASELRQRAGSDAKYRRVLTALSTTEKPLPGRPRHVGLVTRNAYRTARDNLIIPRYKAYVMSATGLIDRVVAAAPAEGKLGFPTPAGTNAGLPAPRTLDPRRLVSEQPLYSYQEAAVAHLCGGPLRPETGGVAYLEMATGLGKTRVGGGVIAKLAVPTLVVVPTAGLAEQWIDELALLFPDLVADVYHNQVARSKKIPPSPQTHDVIIVIINTYRAKSADFLEGFGLVILDEAHEYHSTQNSEALWLSQTAAVLGLSATPVERKDGMDQYVLQHLGPVIYSKDIPGFDAAAVNFRAEVRQINYCGHPDFCETASTPAGTMSAIMTIGNVIRDEFRTRMIAREILRLVTLHETASPEECSRLGLGPRPESVDGHPAGGIRRHGVFVFAEHREYLLELRAALAAEGAANEIIAPELEEKGRAVSVLRGGAARTAIGDARRAGAHIVLTTYGYSRRGVSLPDMTALVRASPRRNGSTQINGRIFRRGSDESIVRQIIDIVDVNTGLRGQFADRCKAYTARGFPIHKIEASWEDYPPQRPPEPTPEEIAAAEEAAARLRAAKEIRQLSDGKLLALALGDVDFFDDLE